MTYSIKEVFLTLQGEGARAGTKAVFVRFAGCNLWDGHPDHRERGAGPCARWCDTDFFRGTPTTAEALLSRMGGLWPLRVGEQRWCVLTGGEPGLQVDLPLVEALRAAGWRISVETNGTVDSAALRACDWVCLSPKWGTDWRTLGSAHEVKVVLPGASPDEGSLLRADATWTDPRLEALEEFVAPSAAELFVQPQDGPELAANTKRCVDFVLAHPRWRLSLQSHKLVGLP